jgi:hypothetical protein
VLAVYLAAVLPLFVCMPLCCDLTYFDVCARTVLRGELLYKEVMVFGAPGLPLLYTGVRGLVGWRSEALRVVDVLAASATVWLLVAQLLPAGLTRAGRAWTAVLLFLFYFGTTEWCHCQPDVWMLLPATAALCLRSRQILALGGTAGSGGMARRGLLEGASWGLAFVIKPFAALPALACFLVSAAVARAAGRGGLRRLAVDVASLLAGGLLVGAACVAWLYLSGNWPYFVANGHAAPSYEEYYARSAEVEDRLLGILIRLWPWSLIHLVALPVSLVVLVRTLSARPRAAPQWQPWLLSQSMLAASYLGWFTEAHFIQHQFDYHAVAPLLVGLTLLASQAWITRHWIVRLAVLPALFVLAVVLNPLLSPSRLALWPRCWREGSTPELRDRLGSLAKDAVFNPTWKDLARVERFLSEQGVKDREVSSWSNSSVAVYSDLRLEPSSRFVQVSSWFAYMPGRRAQIVQEVRTGPQRYVVTDLVENLLVPHDRVAAVDQLPAGALRFFPWNQPVVFRAGRYLVHRVAQQEPGVSTSDQPPSPPASFEPPAQEPPDPAPSLATAPALVARLAALLALMALCAVGPGLFFVRWLRWSPSETLCASLGLTYVLLYLGSMLIYALGLPSGSHYLVTAGCLALTVAAWRDLARLLRHPSVRRQLGGIALLFFWGVMLVALVRHFSGGAGGYDWLEHYERSLYLLHVPRHYDFFRVSDSLASRPPLFNAVAAHYMAQTGTDFPVFQAVELFLDLLVYFPLCLMARLFAGRQKYPRFLLVSLLALSPVLWWNTTFTWTKVFTCFYVILGLWLYLAAWRKGDRARMVGAFVSLAAGCLVHYSAAPYALVLGLHYLVAVLPGRPGRWRELLATGLASGALLATWGLGSAAALGPRATLASNTSAKAFASSSVGDSLGRVAANCAYTALPHPLRMLPDDFDGAMELRQSSFLGRLRDHFLSVYGGNAFLSMGCVGGLLVLYLLVSDLRWLLTRDRPAVRFWVFFLAGSAFVGVAAHPTVGLAGVWNICGQSLTYLGLAFLACRFRTLPVRLRLLALGGCVLDFALGILAQYRLENLAVRFGPLQDGLEFPLLPTGAETLSHWMLVNGFDKFRTHLDYAGDCLAPLAPMLLWLLVVGFGLVVVRMTMVAFDWPPPRSRPATVLRKRLPSP